jgi:hypothetical protein
LLFAVPFYVFLRNDSSKKRNERITDLLKSFNLLNRVWNECEQPESERDIHLNNWAEVSRKLDECKQKGSDYLCSIGL